MRTPKEIFITSGHADTFAKIANSDAFEAACQFAMMQLRVELPENICPGVSTDPLIGFDANAQMVGAARVITILQTLHQPPETPPTPKRETLNYATPSEPHRRQTHY